MSVDRDARAGRPQPQRRVPAGAEPGRGYLWGTALNRSTTLLSRVILVAALLASACDGSSSGAAQSTEASHDSASTGARPSAASTGARTSAASRHSKTSAPSGAGESGFIHVPPRTPHLPTFPCVEQCHVDLTPNPERRKLTEFHSLKLLDHGDEGTWCDRCHDLENLDQLRLIDGVGVSFDQAYLLCGQCHGDKLRDFRAGIHGLQTGSWNGDKIRRSCTACHDPHAPKRPTFEALPAPTLTKETHHE